MNRFPVVDGKIKEWLFNRCWNDSRCSKTLSNTDKRLIFTGSYLALTEIIWRLGLDEEYEEQMEKRR